MSAVYFSCPSASSTFPLQYGGFTPRKWPAAKGLLARNWGIYFGRRAAILDLTTEEDWQEQQMQSTGAIKLKRFPVFRKR